MSLYGALFSGVSGLQSQSSAMSAIADNITNVNTIGYKRTDVQFQTLITKQVSLTGYSAGGVQSKPMNQIDAQGLLQATARATDIAISGNGFFIVNEAGDPSSGGSYAYTRAGSFGLDKDGYLQNRSGWYLQGWPLTAFDGNAQASQVTLGNDIYMKAYKNDLGEMVYSNGNIVDPTNLQSFNVNTIGGTAVATSTISMGMNLTSEGKIGRSHKTDIQIYDSLGNPHNLKHNWVNRAPNAWDYTIIPPYGSKSITIEDQSDRRLNYYTAGRLDLTSIPDAGTSMTTAINGRSYNINFTTAPNDSDVDSETLAFSGLPEDGETIQVKVNGVDTTFEFDNGSPKTITLDENPSDGDTFTMTIDGVEKTFEFDNNSSVSTGNTRIWIRPDLNDTANNLSNAINQIINTELGGGTYTSRDGADTINLQNIPGNVLITTSDGSNGKVNTETFSAGNVSIEIGQNVETAAANLAAKIQNRLTEELGAGTWATSSGSGVTVNQTLNNTSDEVIILANSKDSDISGPPGPGVITAGGGGAPNTSLDIDIQGLDLGGIMDKIAERLQSAMLYEFGGVPGSQPDAWATRLGGESSIYYMNGSLTDPITMDASRLTTVGAAAAIQSSPYTVEALDATKAWTGDSNYAIKFNGDGTPDKIMGADESQSPDPKIQYKITWANGAADMDSSTSPALAVDIGRYNTPGGLTQFSGDYQINYISQNGASFGNFAGVSIGQDGVVTALFDNGVTRPIFMIPVATLVNPNGMESRTGNVYIETDYSGSPTVRNAGDGGAGGIYASSLESSTVDIGEEFTNMITTQRAYSASTKIITTADEMLEELMRIK